MSFPIVASESLGWEYVNPNVESVDDGNEEDVENVDVGEDGDNKDIEDGRDTRIGREV